MKPTIAACLAVLACIAMPVHAAGHLADVAVVDRDTGRQLETYYRHGEYWVAGEPGARYRIAIRNRLGERLLAVTSVDGVNVITGQDAGWDQAGYVLEPWEAYQVSGWRKNDYQVAGFAFTAAAHSYAARTGRPQNVGIIGIALFREMPTSAALETPAPPIASGAPDSAQRSLPPQDRSENQIASQAARAPSAAPAPAPGLGTAHGAREYAYVAHTQFLRRHWQPDEIIRIRYDSLSNLIAMGIVPADRYSSARPSPFPNSDGQSYVPDPPPYDGALLR